MTITTSWAGPRPAVSRTLYGLFLEDINFAADGGLNANLVNNWTFDGAYLDRTGAYGVWTQLLLKRPVRGLEDPLRHWHASRGVLSAQTSGGERPGARYARWQVQGSGQLANHGYPGDSASMGGRRGVAFTLSLLTRADAFTGTLTARLLDTSRTVAATAEVHLPTDGWQRITTTLTPPATGLYSLQFEAIGNGTIDLDEVSLVAADHWGAGDPRWSQGRLRRDLVETLADLRPTFLRFPGGCIVEGTGDGNHYEWKKTVGPLSDRSAKYSLWGRGRRGDYSQSNQIGFYEYFLLCEDLGIEPVPVVWAGLACQYRSHECLDASSPEFAQALQDAVDLVDWATGVRRPARGPRCGPRPDTPSPSP